jgi:threonyl-tRNA synthetase
MIHCALLGSIERFLSVFIEHTAGWFPFWVAPEQIRILTINDTVLDYVDEIRAVLDGVVLMKPVKYNEIRYTLDDRNESLGKKIREATTWKIPVQLIVGQKDKDNREVSIRTQTGEEKISLDALAAYLLQV